MARTATFTTATTVTWSNGVNFDGFVVLVLAPPGLYNQFSLLGFGPRQRIPDRLKLPIVNGVLNGALTAYWNADIEPPNSKYVAYWYDINNTLVASPGSTDDLFAVGSSPYILTVPLMTAPTVAVAVPSALPTASSPAVSPLVQFADNETPGGTPTGTNGSDGLATFTLANSPKPASSLLLTVNGVLKKQGTNYTLAGGTVTFVSGSIPLAGTSLLAFYRY